MKKSKRYLKALLVICFACLCLSCARKESENSQQVPAAEPKMQEARVGNVTNNQRVTYEESGFLKKDVMEGRLFIEKTGKLENLVLHGKNAKAYVIIGAFAETLKGVLSELGPDNLVSLEGKEAGLYSTMCTKKYERQLNAQGGYTRVLEAHCIPHYYFRVANILSVQKSDEKIPDLARDADAEARARALAVSYGPSAVIGQIWGEITFLDLKSPIKTVEITNDDKDSALKKIALIIGSGTVIAKKIGEQAPLFISTDGLRIGQKVEVMYSREELKSEAMSITVKKE